MAAKFEKSEERKTRNAETKMYTPSLEEDDDVFYEADSESNPENPESVPAAESETAEESSAETPDGKKKKEPAPGTPLRKKKRKAPVPVKKQKEMSTTERVAIIVCTFIFAAMIVFVLSGYERITRAYTDINTLNNSIDSVNLHISELNVAIECAVTIEDAEAAAQAAGMTYPSQDQIRSSGESIPVPIAGTIEYVEGGSGEETPDEAPEIIG